MTASSFSGIMKEEAYKLAGKTKEEAPVLSTEDQEITQLEDIRKELRKKEGRSQREKIEYTELNKTVKMKRRQRSRKKRIMLKLYFKVAEDQNIYTREDQRKRYVKGEMKNIKCKTDRNEILKICTRFYTELYSSTPQDQHRH